MEIYTVSLFGHREIEDLREVEQKLLRVIRELALSKKYISFMLGRNGEFDTLAASAIRIFRKASYNSECELVLVLPYTVKDIEFYEGYYDSIIIPPLAGAAHPKLAIRTKNQWMVNNSDLVIAYVEHSHGGAYEAIKYAEKKGKKIINLYVSS